MRNDFLLSIESPLSIGPIFTEMATVPAALKYLQTLPRAETGMSADVCGRAGEVLAHLEFRCGRWLVIEASLYEEEYLGSRYVEKDKDAPRIEIIPEERWTLDAVLADLASWGTDLESASRQRCS